jgi:acrylyl-CoA reductase (NADPH)
MGFRALVSRQGSAPQTIVSGVEELALTALPEGEVLVSVDWSGLNYKDSLVLNGIGGLVKTWPHVAGIDFAGRVVESRDARFHPGQAVILTGWRVGELTYGGYAQRARVKADWLVPMPKGLNTRTAMVLGTAGLAAMMAVNRLQSLGLKARSGEVLVTGAGGGVGSIAVMLLARLGYSVVAATGRPALSDWLTRLGAARVIGREALSDTAGKALGKEQWIAAVDTIGGAPLGEVLKQVRYGGAVAAVGNAAGLGFEASVIPFILRNITLSGVDTVMQPFDVRRAAWDRLATLFAEGLYAEAVTEARLEEVPDLARTLLKGDIAGRVIVTPKPD